MIPYVLAVVMLAVGGWVWSSRGGGAARTAAGSGVKSTVHLETFVLNLADPDPRSYLRVGIDLGLGRELGKGADAPPIAEMRDTILQVLQRLRLEDVQSPSGKATLKAELLRALQARMPAQAVEEVYFTEFLIQR